MKCPYCDNGSTSVVDTRESSEKVRRRRECPECDRRFTTYETVEKYDIRVVKRSGDAEDFREEKVRSGILKATEKTSIKEDEVDEMVENVKNQVRDRKEVSTERIGELVKQQLQSRDEVAYIRFASVCDSFDDAEKFQEEVEALQAEK